MRGLATGSLPGVKLVAIRLEDKKQIVSEVNQAATSALSAVLADYRGVTVSDLTELKSCPSKQCISASGA